MTVTMRRVTMSNMAHLALTLAFVVAPYFGLTALAVHCWGRGDGMSERAAFAGMVATVVVAVLVWQWAWGVAG